VVRTLCRRNEARENYNQGGEQGIMPFKSAKQRAYLYANEPQMAKKWASEHGNRIQKKKGGDISSLSQSRKNVKNPKGVAKGCGAVMKDRRKVTLIT
jgi:hypothetical protein